jgi:ParB/RepB/Spo0J family partition protein
MQIQTLPISKLTLLDKNPRKITKEQFENLIKSIDADPEFLQRRPLLVNYTDGRHIVYAGNQRLRAAKKLGWKEISVIVDVDLDEEIMRARSIKDNNTFGEFDFDMLANEYEVEFLLECGFDLEDLGETKIPEIEEIEEKEEKEKEPKKCPNCGHHL